MENVKLINKFLESNYGRAMDNKPKFRVAWSEDLFETRKGLFGELAVFEEIRKVPKYSYVKDKWILEIYTLAYPQIYGRAIAIKNETILESDGYEPLRIFMNRKKEYLQPDIEICKIICDKWVDLVNRPTGKRLTERIATHDDIESTRKEVAKFEEMLGADDSTLLQQFHDKEAIILPGKEMS